MTREWKPGDVADINGNRVMRINGHRGERWSWTNGLTSTESNTIGAARPLVVIDPEDAHQVGALADLFFQGKNFSLESQMAALREFANPVVKPDEICLLVEFHADGRQYFVVDCHRGRFMEAATDKRRLSIAKVVVESGKVIKNRNGVQS